MNFTSDRILSVAVYCRVSTDKDDQANSLESQQKYFTEYIERNPMWELYDVYVDEGLSGTSTKKRKAFNRMMVDAQLKKFDLIITKEISRFARNTLDSIYYTRQLKEYGVGVMFANDNLFTLDPDAELRLTIMASIAQEESRKTSERVKWGQKRRMEQGVVFGRNMLGYNVREGKLYVDKDGAKVVQKIFHKYVIEQKGTSTIARELREEGIPSFNHSEWTNTVILRILRNEKYCGDLIQKKTITPNYLTHEKVTNKGQEDFIIIRNHHEPIITRELFEMAQIEMAKRSPSEDQLAKLGRRYCFSGKIRCAECGHNFVYHDKKLASGSRYKFWECYNKKKYGKRKRVDISSGKEVGCDCKPISDKDLKLIMQSIIEMLQINSDSILRTMKTQLSEVFSMDGLEDYETKKASLDSLKEKRNALVDLYLDECITKDEFKEKALSMDREIERQEEALGELSRYKFEKKEFKTVVNECLKYAEDFIKSSEISDEFIKAILEEMVIHKTKVIEVKLKLIPGKWKFAIESATKNKSRKHSEEMPLVTDVDTCETEGEFKPKKRKKQAKNAQNDNKVTDVPISVKRPLSSG